MFPDSTRENVSTCLAVYGTVAKAALSLSTTTTLTNDDDSDDDLGEPASLPLILEELKGHMSNEKENVKVDEEHLLNDAMAYYKDPNFHPKKKLSHLQQAACCRDWWSYSTVLHTATPPDV